MKQIKSIFATLFVLCLISSLPTFADETSSVKTTAEEAKTQRAPSVFTSYSYIPYSMQGKTTANTNIYKFDRATTDIQLFTVTWLYNSNWTFLAFAPYIKNMVETVYEPVAGGINYKTTDYTEGLGDLQFMAMSPLWIG